MMADDGGFALGSNEPRPHPPLREGRATRANGLGAPRQLPADSQCAVQGQDRKYYRIEFEKSLSAAELVFLFSRQEWETKSGGEPQVPHR